MDPRATVVAELYRALRDREWQTLAELLAEDAEFGLSGRSPVAGTYRGRDDIVAAIRRLVDETDGTLGPVRDDTWDICTSEHHVILIEWLQATRQRRRSRFYIHLVCAVEGSEVKRAFANFDSQYDFDELWS
jgi:ketosteroid isomerase-like protein